MHPRYRVLSAMVNMEMLLKPDAAFWWMDFLSLSIQLLTSYSIQYIPNENEGISHFSLFTVFENTSKCLISQHHCRIEFQFVFSCQFHWLFVLFRFNSTFLTSPRTKFPTWILKEKSIESVSYFFSFLLMTMKSGKLKEDQG